MYLRSQQIQVEQDLNRIDNTWIHSSVIKKHLFDLQDLICRIYNKLNEKDSTLREISLNSNINYDRKKEKYTQWVEVMRLALFQYERFSLNGSAFSEGLYSTLGMLAATWNSVDLNRIEILGCGPGRSVLDFSKLFPTSIIEGLDYSLLSLLLAEKIICGAAETPLLRRDIYTSNYSELIMIPGMNRDNACFGLIDLSQDIIPKADMIVCSNVINLLPNHQKVIKNIYDSLIPGGLIIFADLLGWRLDRESNRKGIQTNEKIASLFQDVGFITIDQFDGVPYIESESADQFVFYKEHFYVGRKK